MQELKKASSLFQIPGRTSRNFDFSRTGKPEGEIFTRHYYCDGPSGVRAQADNTEKKPGNRTDSGHGDYLARLGSNTDGTIRGTGPAAQGRGYTDMRESTAKIIEMEVRKLMKSGDYATLGELLGSAERPLVKAMIAEALSDPNGSPDVLAARREALKKAYEKAADSGDLLTKALVARTFGELKAK